MSERLFRVVSAVQEGYLKDPALNDLKTLADRVRWLDEERLRLAGEFAEGAEDVVIEREIIAKLPPRLVHEVFHRWAYLEADVTPPTDTSMPHDELSTLHWYDRADRATVDSPEPVGDHGDCDRLGMVEDAALAPRMNWTDTDRKAVLEEAIRIYGIEPGQCFDVEWPPEAHLYDPGSVYESDMEPCDSHVCDGGDDDCVDCASSVQTVIESMAQWKWTTELQIFELTFDREGQECSTREIVDQAFEVATTEQDPREVLIGPPGRGRHW